MTIDRGKVYIVDDDALLLHSVGGLLQDAGFSIKTFASGEDFLNEHIEPAPCCVLLDIKMHGLSGLELQDKLLKRDFLPPIIFLTGSATVEEGVDAVRKGAYHFLIKPVDGEVLINAAKEAIQVSLQDAQFFSDIKKLTPMEKKIAMLVREGMLSKQIANHLEKSVRTVEWHRSNIIEKLRQ